MVFISIYLLFISILFISIYFYLFLFIYFYLLSKASLIIDQAYISPLC